MAVEATRANPPDCRPWHQAISFRGQWSICSCSSIEPIEELFTKGGTTMTCYGG